MNDQILQEYLNSFEHTKKTIMNKFSFKNDRYLTSINIVTWNLCCEDFYSLNQILVIP